MSQTITQPTDTQQRFSDLLDEHQAVVAKVARTYAWQREDQEELAQEIVAQLWRAFPRFDAQQRFSTWMYRVSLNTAITWVRRHTMRQRHVTTLGDEVEAIADQSPSLENDERRTFLMDFISACTPLNRALLLLYLEDHSHRDIAAVLGISESNVATKINRLKQQARRLHAAATH
ncbi:MAG: sigma-70 family RNA polymerase sigma factor [Pseudomonadota bacterium]